MDGIRSKLGCTRHDLEPVEWDVDIAQVCSSYHGRHPGDVQPQEPWKSFPFPADQPRENPADGCPGGWYRSPFALSLIRYLRHRDEHGGRVSNHLLDRCDDPLIHDAVLYYEREHDRVFSLQAELIASKHGK